MIDAVQQECIIVEPTKQHTHTIILLHGRDSEVVNFKTDFFESQDSDDRYLTDIFPSIKWVLPRSKKLYATRFEQELSQWFDIWSVENPEEKKEIQIAGLKESIELILHIVSVEATFVALENIILGGISQGCATAIISLLLGRIRLGGFIGFSSWLPFQKEIDYDHSLQTIADILKPVLESLLNNLSSPWETPVLIEHCRDDEVVPVCNGLSFRTSLKALGMNAEWKMYEQGGHWINEPQGINDMVAFVRKCFNLRCSKEEDFLSCKILQP